MRKYKVHDYTQNRKIEKKRKIHGHNTDSLSEFLLKLLIIVIMGIIIFLGLMLVMGLIHGEKGTFYFCRSVYTFIMGFSNFYCCRYASCYFNPKRKYIIIRNEFIAELFMAECAGNGRNVMLNYRNRFTLRSLIVYLISVPFLTGSLISGILWLFGIDFFKILGHEKLLDGYYMVLILTILAGSIAACIEHDCLEHKNKRKKW